MSLLLKSVVGSRTYWGDQGFVEEQIRLLESGQGKRLGSGSFGVGWAVGPYLVKKTHTSSKPEKFSFEQEADAANMLQNKIPDYVTQLKGARYGLRDRNDYIIFDLLQGDTLTGYIKKLQTEAIHLNMTSSTLHRNFSYLFQALKMSSKAMTAAGWSHCDLKPDNVFFNVQKNGDLYDWSTAVCWLIDFGSATQFGKQLPYSVTPIYSITYLKTESEHPNADCGLPIGTVDQLIRDIEINACKEKARVSEKYNAASCDLIWLNDMKKLIVSAPKKPLTIKELGFNTDQDYLVMRKRLIDRLRPQAQPLPSKVANPVNPRPNAQAAQQQAVKNFLQRVNAKLAEQPQAAQQNIVDGHFTGIQEVRNGVTYKQVTNGKETWWEDPKEIALWDLPAQQVQNAQKAAQNAQKAAQQAVKAAQNAQQNAQQAAQRLAEYQAAQQAAQKVRQAKLNAMKAPTEPYFTGIKEVRNGKTYNQVSDGKDKWWERNKKSYWELPAQEAPIEAHFTGKKEERNGMTYNQVTNDKETWWEDLNGKTYWVIPSSGLNAARYAADDIARRKAEFNAQFKGKGGSRRSKTHRKRKQVRRTRKHYLI
jgi:serine/threonine protein kinase